VGEGLLFAWRDGGGWKTREKWWGGRSEGKGCSYAVGWAAPALPSSMRGRSEEGEGAGEWGDGRRLGGGREWDTGSRVRDLFIRSKHDFSHWIDDRWSIIAGSVGLKRA
jgi:hypothetical protein